jgi:hypothetical protein
MRIHHKRLDKIPDIYINFAKNFSKKYKSHFLTIDTIFV